MSTDPTSTAIAVNPGLFLRVLMNTPVLRRLVPIDKPTEFVAGSDYVSGAPPAEPYPSRGALSAYGAFPWVVACCSALSTDLSSVPITVHDRSGKQLESHPLLELLKQPSERTPGVTFFHQWVTDYALVGWAPRLVLQSLSGEPESLVRLHTARTRIQPSSNGEPDRYLYGLDNPRAYRYTDVLCPKQPSFEDGPNSVYGQGAIRALHRDLSADLSAQQLAQRSARTGRPSAVATPASGSGIDRWNKNQVRSLTEQLRSLARDSHGGIAVLNGLVDIKPLGWSPRDMEFGEGRKLTRETVLAAFHVPPSRVGLPTANYATQEQQNETYWTHIVGMSRVFQAELNRLGSMYSDPVSVRYDFSSIQALQRSRTDRLDRVGRHISNGLSPSDAYRLEGFELASKLASDSLKPDTETESRTVAEILRTGSGPIPRERALELARILEVGWRASG